MISDFTIFLTRFKCFSFKKKTVKKRTGITSGILLIVRKMIQASYFEEKKLIIRMLFQFKLLNYLIQSDAKISSSTTQ